MGRLGPHVRRVKKKRGTTCRARRGYARPGPCARRRDPRHSPARVPRDAAHRTARLPAACPTTLPRASPAHAPRRPLCARIPPRAPSVPAMATLTCLSAEEGAQTMCTERLRKAHTHTERPRMAHTRPERLRSRTTASQRLPNAPVQSKRPSAATRAERASAHRARLEVNAS